MSSISSKKRFNKTTALDTDRYELSKSIIKREEEKLALSKMVSEKKLRKLIAKRLKLSEAKVDLAIDHFFLDFKK